MKILVVGNGGREHTLAWKLASDSAKPRIFCAPGNAGTAELGANIPINADDVAGIVKWCKENGPDLVVVGPEAPLCLGLSDSLAAAGIRVFGPCRAAAMLEGSKVFAKEIMTSAGVPTASASVFTNAADAVSFIKSGPVPVVVKADGLAAGKGVYVCQAHEEAVNAVNEIMEKRVFGEAGGRIVVEEYLDGEEASMLALVDGEAIVLLDSSQDHKRIFNDDIGPNTGGMGAYSPAPVVTEALLPVIKKDIFQPVVSELRKRGITYKGVLYAGIMVTSAGPKVLEFNCRFGDPETQAVLPRIDGDLLPLLEACIDGKLGERMLRWKKEDCVCVVMASGGYPDSYEKGQVIHGLDAVRNIGNVFVFHAGTKKSGDKTVTAGGRVLGVTALGASLLEARKNVYTAISKLSFDQAQYRTDIGIKALRRRQAQ